MFFIFSLLLVISIYWKTNSFHFIFYWVRIIIFILSKILTIWEIDVNKILINQKKWIINISSVFSCFISMILIKWSLYLL